MSSMGTSHELFHTIDYMGQAKQKMIFRIEPEEDIKLQSA